MKNSYTKKDILESLQNCGIKKGDTVFVTTSLGMFGFLKTAKSLDDINEAFYLSLCECVGASGSIIVPTYSYTFGQHTVTSPAMYDKEKTAAEIGPFPEFFRHQEGVVRSSDPFMSVAIKGPASALIENLTSTSYGHDCFFERLLGNNVICLNLGLGPNWTPFIHYADFLVKAPFRYDKLFSGMFTGSSDVSQWLYSVPLLSPEATANAHAVGLSADAKGIWRYAELARGRIYKASYDEYFNFVMDNLRSDPWALADGNACDIKELELRRCNTPQKDFAKRGAITFYINDFVNMAANKMGFEVELFDTGFNAFDHVVPEAWYSSGVSIISPSGKAVDIDVTNVTPYSQSFNGHVSHHELKGHFNIESIFPRYIERDWSFSADKSLISEQGNYEVKLNCGTYFSHVITGFRKGSYRFIYVINATDYDKNRSIFDSKLTELQNTPYCLLIVAHEVGLIAWLAKYQNELMYNEEIQLLCASECSVWHEWDVNGYNPATQIKLSEQVFNFKKVNF